MVSFSSATWLHTSAQALFVYQLIDTEGKQFLSLLASTWAPNHHFCFGALWSRRLPVSTHLSSCPSHHQPSSLPTVTAMSQVDAFNPKRGAAALTAAVASKLVTRPNSKEL